MATPMMSYFARRRLWSTGLLILAVLGVVWQMARLGSHHRQAALLSGWALLAVCIFLAMYGGRKRLPFLPLGTSRAWLQLHVYLGYLTFVLFFAHTHWGWPSGWFEQSLAILFLGVAVSGVWGLLLSRWIPRRLTARGGEILLERIPIVRTRLADQIKEMALDSVDKTRSTIMADFYLQHLADFMARPRNLALHLLESRTPMNQLQTQINDLNRFLNDEQRMVMAKIAALVRQKDELDYQRSLQLSLRLWLFTHIPLTYSLLIFTALHVVLVFGFSSGVQPL